jgi:protein transport protein SEC31
MVRLREIPRTAAFAWSPSATAPSIVTGTKAGAVDADFSNETQLELWDLDLGNRKQGVELQPIASIVADSRCVIELQAAQIFIFANIFSNTVFMMLPGVNQMTITQME